MRDTKGDIALVTGASSGIGAAIVRRLTGAGREVVALARRADRLAALAEETGCRTEALDVTDGERAEAFVRELEPGVLVNNAGTGQGIDGLEGADAAAIRNALLLNVEAPIRLTRAAVPPMRERGGGHVVNMGSIAGLYPIVSAVYGAGKGAVHLFSQNLRVELRGTGIRVTEIAPGRTTTEFYDAAVADEAARARMTQTGITELSPDDVASAVLWAIEAPVHVNVGLIELTPTEQALGGAHLVPVGGAN